MAELGVQMTTIRDGRQLLYLPIHHRHTMPSPLTTFLSEDAYARGPLRRIVLLENLASEIHGHNITKGRVVDFRRKIESLRRTVWQAEQTITLLCQQLTSLDEQRVGRLASVTSIEAR